MIFALAGLFYAAPARANEKIADYDVSISVSAEAALSVTERITYDYGDLEKHGIFRSIPLSYKARGVNYDLKLSDFTVTDQNGDAHPFEVITQGNYLRLKIGEEGRIVTGLRTYLITYRADRAIKFFADYDELYWNVIGNEWEVPIEQVKTEISLPQSFGAEAIKAECAAGRLESAGGCVSTRYVYGADNTVSRLVFANDRLDPGEGLAVTVSWPKGGVAEPNFFAQVIDYFKSNWLYIALALALFFIFYLVKSRRRKKALNT